MEITADLHSHSAYAGGAYGGGKSVTEKEKRIVKRFVDAANYSPLKGIDLIGVGDCQFEPWMLFLEKNLEEVETGIFSYTGLNKYELISDLDDYRQPNYLLQTELIITGPSSSLKQKKKAHILILFPNFARIKELNELLDKFSVSRKKMARPFIVNKTVEEIEYKLHAILDLDSNIEIIPAHVLTPEGIYGGNQRINRLSDLFGSVANRINAIETGLSADPEILGLIPELDNRTLISNADAHSAALNRVGREFTTFTINKYDYNSIISSIRKNKVVKTAEFHPTEGRYFLTGHRAGRKKPKEHKKMQYCYFSPKHVPKDGRCPQCNKELTIGVLQRAFEISIAQGEPRKLGDGPKRSFITMVPLIEIIAYSLNMKSVTSKKALKVYIDIMKVIKTESNLWNDSLSEDILHDSGIPENTINAINQVESGNFCFTPIGYDGTYGMLQIGKELDFEDISVIQE